MAKRASERKTAAKKKSAPQTRATRAAETVGSALGRAAKTVEGWLKLAKKKTAKTPKRKTAKKAARKSAKTQAD